jgi:hypothetical protein
LCPGVSTLAAYLEWLGLMGVFGSPRRERSWLLSESPANLKGARRMRAVATSTGMYRVATSGAIR